MHFGWVKEYSNLKVEVVKDENGSKNKWCGVSLTIRMECSNKGGGG